MLSFVLTAKKPCSKRLGKRLAKAIGVPAVEFIEQATERVA